jgi:hypothetical protein
VKGLSARQRPSQVGYWVQRSRTGTPEIKDIATFAKEWQTWWQDINPGWHKISLPMLKKDSLWEYLDVTGPNSFLSVVVCLKWWREKLEEELLEWEDAVQDVTWVLKRINR